MYFTNISSLGLDFIRSFIWTHLVSLNMKRDILKGVCRIKIKPLTAQYSDSRSHEQSGRFDFN